MKLFLLSSIILCACIAPTHKKPGDIVMSYPFAQDSFLVRTNNFIDSAKPGDTVHVVYYSDGSLNSGKQVEIMIGENENKLQQHHYVFVGIAHFGHFRAKRRRDFIMPSVKTENGYGGLNANYGQADSFYHFLKDKIILQAEKDLSGYVIQRSFIGHSLGGLFAVYLLVSGDTLFTNLYSLSPSLWIDHYHILNYESSKQEELKNLHKNLWVSCGSAETFNRIRRSVGRIEDTLALRKYPGLRYYIKVYDGKTHNSAVPPALKDIFEAL